MPINSSDLVGLSGLEFLCLPLPLYLLKTFGQAFFKKVAVASWRQEVQPN